MELDEVATGRAVRVLKSDGNPMRDTATGSPLEGTVVDLIKGGLVEIRLRGSAGVVRAFSHRSLEYL